GKCRRQVELDLVQRIFGQLEQHKPRRRVAGDLPAKLRADRAAGAGDHHDLVAEPVAQPRTVEHDGIAAQQIIELDLPYASEADTPADQVVVRRNGQRLDAGLRADLRNAPADFVVGR